MSPIAAQIVIRHILSCVLFISIPPISGCFAQPFISKPLNHRKGHVSSYYSLFVGVRAYKVFVADLFGTYLASPETP